jgi:hypothetical protein
MLSLKSRRISLINRPSISVNSRVSVACDADRIAEHFLILHKAKIADRFEIAMKDKRYESDSAYTKDGEQKLGRSSVFLICDVR